MSFNTIVDGEDTLQFERDGAEYCRGLLPPETVSMLIEEFKNYSEQNKEFEAGIIWDINDIGKKSIRYIPQTHLCLYKFTRLISSNILSKASKFLKEDAYFATMDLHCRDTGKTPITPPHQDAYLWCFEDGKENMLSCYIALVDMDLDTAGLRIITGGHKDGILPHKASKIRGFSSVIEETPHQLPEYMQKNEHIVRLKAGDALFFHSCIVHYTMQDKNPTKERMAISVRICGQSAERSDAKRAIYEENVRYNRSFTVDEGLTQDLTTPRHIS